MEKILLIIILLAFAWPAAQIKETVQLATLTPTFLVVQSDIESYQKLHYTVSTTLYMGSYMITELYWKAAVIALLISASKEVAYDGLLGKGEPLWEDMKWNTPGTTQRLYLQYHSNFSWFCKPFYLIKIIKLKIPG